MSERIVYQNRREVTPGSGPEGVGSGRTLPPVFFAPRAVEGPCAVTDRGQRVPLFHYEALLAAPAAEASARRGQLATQEGRREFLLEMEGQFVDRVFPSKQGVFRLAEPNPLCNCHGWIFAGGRFGVEDQYIPRILADNGYTEATQPCEGDLVIYYHETAVAHAGRVQSVERGVVVVMSKWGPFGVFLHPVEAQPFSPSWSFQRTTRGGHLLFIDRRAPVDSTGA